MTDIAYKDPSHRIAHFVQGIFILEQHGGSPVRLPLFANGTPTLVLHKTMQPQTTISLQLYGQTISPAEILLNPQSTLIAYFFRPWCLYSLFGLESNELTDQPVDFSLISGDPYFKEKLLNAHSREQICSFVEDHIACLAMGDLPDVRRINYAVGRIMSMPHRDILPRIQQELNTTERSFQRMFVRNIGVSPNTFRRIIQFNNAFQQLNQRKFSHLSDVAFDNGFADQSHFNRTFREFTHQTATQYLDNCPT